MWVTRSVTIPSQLFPLNLFCFVCHVERAPQMSSEFLRLSDRRRSFLSWTLNSMDISIQTEFLFKAKLEENVAPKSFRITLPANL